MEELIKEGTGELQKMIDLTLKSGIESIYN
jgi:hypothetical protein